MTKTEKKNLIPKIVIGSYLSDGYDMYKVTDVYKRGIRCQRDWDIAGHFYEPIFVSYEELYNTDDWKTIIV